MQLIAPVRSRMTQSAHFVSLMRIGFRWGGVISLTQDGDLQPMLESASDIAVEARGRVRTSLVCVPSAKEPIGLEAILRPCRHGNEVLALEMVSAVNNLDVARVRTDNVNRGERRTL